MGCGMRMMEENAIVKMTLMMSWLNQTEEVLLTLWHQWIWQHPLNRYMSISQSSKLPSVGKVPAAPHSSRTDPVSLHIVQKEVYLCGWLYQDAQVFLRAKCILTESFDKEKISIKHTGLAQCDRTDSALSYWICQLTCFLLLMWERKRVCRRKLQFSINIGIWRTVVC